MSDLMSQATRARFGAAIVALAPAVMLAGLFAHPYIATLPDEAAVTVASSRSTCRRLLEASSLLCDGALRVESLRLGVIRVITILLFEKLLSDPGFVFVPIGR